MIISASLQNLISLKVFPIFQKNVPQKVIMILGKNILMFLRVNFYSFVCKDILTKIRILKNGYIHTKISEGKNPPPPGCTFSVTSITTTL